jgi:hypothetical protein
MVDGAWKIIRSQSGERGLDKIITEVADVFAN